MTKESALRLFEFVKSLWILAIDDGGLGRRAELNQVSKLFQLSDEVHTRLASEIKDYDEFLIADIFNWNIFQTLPSTQQLDDLALLKNMNINDIKENFLKHLDVTDRGTKRIVRAVVSSGAFE